MVRQLWHSKPIWQVFVRLDLPLKAAAPTAQVVIDLGTATVSVDGADEAQVKKAVDDAGFDFQGAA
jgi:copper chaperone